MSYHYHLDYLPKETVEAIQGMTMHELDAWIEANHPESWNPREQSLEIWSCFGQTAFFDLCNHPKIKKIFDTTSPLFNDKIADGVFDHIKLLTKEDFIRIVNAIREMVYKNYENLRDSSYEHMKAEFDFKAKQWGVPEYFAEMRNLSEEQLLSLQQPYDLRENSESIVNSYLWEYQIFELVRLYKTFDWDKNALIFYGW